MLTDVRKELEELLSALTKYNAKRNYVYVRDILVLKNDVSKKLEECRKNLLNAIKATAKKENKKVAKLSVEQVIKETTPTQNTTTKNVKTITQTIERVDPAAGQQKERPETLDLRYIHSRRGHTKPAAQTPSPQSNNTKSSATTSQTGRRGPVNSNRSNVNNHPLSEEQTTTQGAKVHLADQGQNSPVDPLKRKKELIIASLAEIGALAVKIISLSGDEKFKNHKDIVHALGLKIRGRLDDFSKNLLDDFSKNLGDKQFSSFANDIREYINYTEKALAKEPGLWANFLRPIVNAMLSLINNIRVLCGVKKGYGLFQSTSDIWKDKGFGNELRDRLEGNNLHNAATFEEEERNKEEKERPTR